MCDHVWVSHISLLIKVLSWHFLSHLPRNLHPKSSFYSRNSRTKLLENHRMTNTSNTPNYSPHFVGKWGEVQRRIFFCIEGRVILRRGCSDKGELEIQELTFECVLTTPIRSLAHKHWSFKYDQDRHVNRCPWNGKSSCSVVSPKKPPLLKRRGRGRKDRVDKSMGIVTLIQEALVRNKPTIL